MLQLRPDSAKGLAGFFQGSKGYSNGSIILYIFWYLCLALINNTCENTGGWGGGSAAKALEGAFRLEAESTAYKKLRHSTFVS